MSAWEGKRISASWDEQIFQLPCMQRNTRHWLGERSKTFSYRLHAQAIQSLDHLLTRTLTILHNTKCVTYRCHLRYNYSPCMANISLRRFAITQHLHKFILPGSSNCMVCNSEGVRRYGQVRGHRALGTCTCKPLQKKLDRFSKGH